MTLYDPAMSSQTHSKFSKLNKLPRMLLGSYTFLERLLNPQAQGVSSSAQRSNLLGLGKRKASVEVTSPTSHQPSDALLVPVPLQHKRYGWSWKLGLYEIRYWHAFIYREKNDSRSLSPSELGRAAAYEAFRTWIHNQPTLKSLNGAKSGIPDREILTGVAVFEVLRLLQSLGDNVDRRLRDESTEAAAHTIAFLITIPIGKARNSRTQTLGTSNGQNAKAFERLDVLYASDDVLMHQTHSLSSASDRSSKSAERPASLSLRASPQSEFVLDILPVQPSTAPAAITTTRISRRPISMLALSRPGHRSDPLPSYHRIMLENASVGGRKGIHSAPTTFSIFEKFADADDDDDTSSDEEERVSYATSRTVSTDYGNGMFYTRRAISMSWSTKRSSMPPIYTS
ncbi:hypothetical protein D9613_009966 [Agrocybe pediades]|uniref:Uncharacterized protein n=1 Tax=Agrocybe pediades TaxID=84607 RepID=A0A8H4VSD2_9AGAR|nr:hypothetical protein D9613_009966 [Agrocybe pediades]